MRIMAFDYGTKRIGIAVSDPLQLIASPLQTIHPEKIWDFLESYLASEQVRVFVVGMPAQLDGSPSESAQHVKGFSRKLKKKYPHIDLQLIDERFTSKMASASILASGANRKQRQDKGLVDVVSAALILQSYMEMRAIEVERNQEIGRHQKGKAD